MITTITLNNGKTELVASTEHFTELVNDNMGSDARNYLDSKIEKLQHDADYNQAKINTDLTSYEMDLQSNTSCFIEILDTVTQLKTITNSKRVNKQKLNELLEHIDTLINIQI